jgi:glutamyl-tRNA reductase
MSVAESISLLGVSHRTADFDVLARIAPAVEATACEVRDVADESLALFTCNRAELWFTGTVEPAAVAADLARRARMEPRELLPHLLVARGGDAARHAMRVASGLESMILGEVQILGQLKRALERGQVDGAVGPVLSQLFHFALQSGRRARVETEISRHATSVSDAAARVALTDIRDPAAMRVLVIGTGEAAELAARALRSRGVVRITVAGRTPAHAEAVAARLGAGTVAWADLRGALAEATVVVSATGAREHVIGPEDLLPRPDRPLTLVDLALPPDVDTAVEQVPGVRRHDLERLRSLVGAGLARREAAIPAVEEIVDDEAERFRRWLVARELVPTITQLRAQVERVVHSEARTALGRLGYGDDVEGAADHLAQRIAAKVLHQPVVRLKAQAARDGAMPHVVALRDLFGLDGGDES